MQGLTVGRIVHYVDSTGFHMAAIVVDVYNDERGTIDLHVFPASRRIYTVGLQIKVPYSSHPEARTWHWIEPA